MVGSLSPENEASYGRIFSRYLEDPQNFFVISSDFCHWGEYVRLSPSEFRIWKYEFAEHFWCQNCKKKKFLSIVGDRFSYTYYDKTKGEIWQSIESLDRMVSFDL